jgi:hypothetical protein
MDKFSRNYSIVLAIVVGALLFLFTHKNPELAEMNALLDADSELAAYPYTFRVLRIEDRVAIMTTPRSPEFPAYRALGLLFPDLANLPQEDPRLMQGQLVMAGIQEHAREIVLGTGHVSQVEWEIDRQWLADHGVQVVP